MQRNKMLFVYLLVVLSLASCSSVPLQTMWRMRNMKVNDLVKINPNDLGVRIICEASEILISENTEFSVSFTDKSQKTLSYKFPLEAIYRKESEKKFFRRKKIITETTFKLTAEGIDDFVEFQKTSSEADYKHGKGAINILFSFKTSKGEKYTGDFELSIEVKLNNNEGFFTLIDSVNLKMEKE